jgi:hypothetical protein
MVHGDPSDFWRFTPDGAHLLAAKAGFEVVSAWAPGGAALVAGEVLGAHVDYWSTADFLPENSSSDWPLATYLLLEKNNSAALFPSESSPTPPNPATSADSIFDAAPLAEEETKHTPHTPRNTGALHAIMAAEGSDKAQHGFDQVYDLEFSRWKETPVKMIGKARFDVKFPTL